MTKMSTYKKIQMLVKSPFIFSTLILALLSSCGRTTVLVGGTSPYENDCANLVDDDGDELVDCADPDCDQDPNCQSSSEICNNGIDDDNDEFIDCQDLDCQGDPVCQSSPEICYNGIDDDNDNLIDCNDPQCFADPVCIRYKEICDNGIDDDNDNLIDCNDPQCFADPVCIRYKEICYNGIDDDNNGLIDCYDPACFNDPNCATMPEICDNGIDDDNNGLIDCYDPACFNDPSCAAKPEICDNGIDDDNNGLIDCYDPVCFNDPRCKSISEICNNGIDDDGNGYIDCDDPQCKQHPACPDENCSNFKDDDGDGYIDCKDPDCFKHPDCIKPGLEICNNGIDDDDDELVDCDDPECVFEPICKPGNEICNNGIDDDNDGAIDCNDIQCLTFPACKTLVCQPTVDFGTLKTTGSSSTKTVVTLNTPDVYQTNCALPGGGEIVTQFTLSGKSDIKLTFSQTSGDHSLALFKAGIAEPCNAHPIQDCYDTQAKQNGEFSIKSLEAGDYYLIVEAFAIGREGSISITLSTGSAGITEICNNGIDDDGDLSVDCEDVECIFNPSCVNMFCDYDVNLGTLVLGDPQGKTITVDTTTGSNNYEEICAAGGGKDRVIRFVMPTAGYLSAKTQQTGWHVYTLYKDKGPGTRCDAETIDACFNTGGYYGFLHDMGMVEKGVYYFMVDALSPGNEGSVTVTFIATIGRAIELCTNGVDDDGDTYVDCMDPECKNHKDCSSMVCVPEFKTGPLKANDPPATFSFNTKSYNSDQTLTCGGKDGNDVVIEVNVPQVSKLWTECTQTGLSDHVIGLFIAGDSRDPCDKTPYGCADPNEGIIGCHFFWGNTQPGTYYVIVQAFNAGTEGDITISLWTTPDSFQENCSNGIDDDNDGDVDCYDSNCTQAPSCQAFACSPDNPTPIIIPSNGTPASRAVNTNDSTTTDAVSTTCASNSGGKDEVLNFTLTSAADLHVNFFQSGNHVLAIYKNHGKGFPCDKTLIDCQKTNGQTAGTTTFFGLSSGDYYLVIDADASGKEGSVLLEMSAQ